MSVSELVQLYAPLAGLLVLAFWVGALSQKVANLKEDVKDLEEGADAAGTIRDRLTRIEVKFEGVEGDLTSIKRGMEGVQRQLGNLMGAKGGQVLELPGAQ